MNNKDRLAPENREVAPEAPPTSEEDELKGPRVLEEGELSDQEMEEVTGGIIHTPTPGPVPIPYPF